ncbi:MAG: hypothetical protein H7Y27_16205 [Gemmatimonadaceae bacterium]|nr:hypothetical protein [Chitinophagaceae bacterium]
MKRLALVAALIASVNFADAQYYYKDIVVTRQISGTYKLLRDNKVRGIQGTPFEGNRPVTEGILLQQTLYPQQNMLITHTKAANTTESWLKSYYSQSGLLVRTIDSAQDLVNRSNYTYDDGGKLLVISSTLTPRNNPAETEVHQWTYTATGKPAQMLKIKNGSDTTFVNYTADEQGNAGEEHVTRKKNNLGTTYYYYNGGGQLTDIARYNKRVDKVLPDYIFEYNDQGLVGQMIVVPEGTSDYQIWRYLYNDKGLKEKEICFNKQKQMVGRVEYAYQF